MTSLERRVQEAKDDWHNEASKEKSWSFERESRAWVKYQDLKHQLEGKDADLL